MPEARKLVLCTGSRDFPDENRAKQILRYYFQRTDVVMHGGAEGKGHHPSGDKSLPWGGDWWAKEVAEELEIRQEVEPYIGKLGRAGGMARNQKMVDRCVKAKEQGWNVLVVGIHHNNSKGTAHCLARATVAGLEVMSFTMDLPLPQEILDFNKAL